MASKSKNKKAISFVFILVLIDMIGFGIIMPVLPDLIRELTGKNLAEAGYYALGLMLAFAVMQFLFSPLVGNLSDRFGRRPILLISLAGFGINYLLMAFAPTIIWLFIGRLLVGIFSATYSTANAFIADISAPENRAANFGLIGAAFGVGFIIGPVLGGFLGEYIGVRAPFYAAALVALVNVIFGLFVLPETLPKEKRRKFEWKRANPFGAFKHLSERPVVMGLAVVMLFFGIGHQVYPSVWSFYGMQKLQMSSLDVGLSLGFVGIVFGLSQAFVTRWSVAKYGEIFSAKIGLIVLTLAFLGYAFVTSIWQIYVIITLSFFSSIIGPTLNGIMSNRTAEDEQGELQGALASIAAIGAIIGPVIFLGLFGYFSSETAIIYLPGAPFIAASLVTFIGLIWFLALAEKMKKDNKTAE
ncbi:MAG: TCR/Tet family MFS transporter [Robiginitomaculum sp.]|nr:TCR/Tet family MFS transporter [Robiginitomaculum sp.]